MLGIGIMSGTSLDGVDVALIKIEKNDVYNLVDFISIPYEVEFKEKIKRNLSDDTAKLNEICSLKVLTALRDLKQKTQDQSVKKEIEDIERILHHGI